MSGGRGSFKREGGRGDKSEKKVDASCSGLSHDFFKAEEEFKAQPKSDWETVQRGKNKRKDKSKSDVRDNGRDQFRSQSHDSSRRSHKNRDHDTTGSGHKNRDHDTTGSGHKNRDHDTTGSGHKNRDYETRRDSRNPDVHKHDKKYGNYKQETRSHVSNKRPEQGHRERVCPEESETKPGISYTRLKQMSQKDSTDIIQCLANSTSGLNEFLEGNIKPDHMFLIVKILSKLTKSDWEENKQHVLTKAATADFFKKITSFVLALVTDEQNSYRTENMEQFFDELLTFFHSVLNLLPSIAADHLKAPLTTTKMVMGHVSELRNITISSKLLDRMTDLMSVYEERKKEKEIREQILTEEIEKVYPKPLGSIRNIPLFPRPEDIACRQGSVVPNKIKGPYNNVEHYLDVHFRLLREDFISPVRQGINEYRIGRSNNKSKSFKKATNIKIYPRVKFLKPKVIADKVGYDICFDPEKRLKVKWEYSKRFIFGSLLLFTTDNFHTFFIATVVKRDIPVVEKDRVVSVILADTTELSKDILSKEFLMAESEVYFEPYYNVLKALQKFDSETFPMKKYIVFVDRTTQPPAYTKNGSDVYSISLGENGINGRKTIRLFDDYTWPSCGDLGFDDTQMRAFKAALTNDLAVIQGPPGTGKTFLGLKIAAALLENSVNWNSDKKTPILVLCYTNHALDQFLEGVVLKNLTNNVVRIGGRSKSEVLEMFNLKEKRKCVLQYFRNHDQAALLGDLKKEMSSIFETIKCLQDNLESLEKYEGIISITTLRLVLNEAQQSYFKNNDDLLEWLLYGSDVKIRSKNKLITTHDKQLQYRREATMIEDFGLDSEDYENVRRLKEVLFDNLDFEEPCNSHQQNSQIRICHSCTLDEIQKKIEEYGCLLETLPSSEEKPETIKEQLRSVRNAEKDLKLIMIHFEEKLKKTAIPSQEDTDRLYGTTDMSTLSSNDRWLLYKCWIEFLKAGYWTMIGKSEERYRRGSRRFEEIRQFDDLKIVQQADVVGVTTTSAARLQAMLRELKPKIVIVEEAAEVLEAHIVASLSVNCQHLILIGDHKQLRPSPADYKLGKDYHLEISLFERLIDNGVSFHTLSTQHRMRPEISSLLVPAIYPTLRNHLSTLGRERVRGMDNNLFFMTHHHFEEGVEDIMSKRNIFEAQLVMRLARHLILQGYKPDQITVLATYSGQMFLMKEEQKRLEISPDLLVTVVDNFQGEENKIILLSLVRSNADNRIGFLKIENRVCVALSRARDGLFVFGNMDCLCTESTLWQRIRQSFINHNAYGPALVLRCETHRSEITRVTTASDFNQVVEGGCSKPCAEPLPCGHHCKSLCHVSKDRHIKYRCSEPCIRYLGCNRHLCAKKCYQECGKCTLSVTRTLSCGHQLVLQCCVDYRNLQCKQLVTIEFLECNHKMEVECFRKEYKKCPMPCGFRLDCGHACLKTCHPLDDPDHLEYVCTKPCPRRPLGCTTDSHKCPLTCSETCIACTVTVVKRLPCGHNKTVQCNSSDRTCYAPCERTMTCGHRCQRSCWKQCVDCLATVEKVVPRCGHKVKVACYKAPTKLDCEGRCVVRLECGHKCAKPCREPCDSADCKEPTALPVALPCGHTGATVPCHLARILDLRASTDREELVQYCSEPCLQQLNCTHMCSGTCGQCLQGRIHKVCEEDCNNTLICGHSCPVPCRTVCPPCEKKCQNQCKHAKCPKKCGEPCVPCMEPCEYKCVHSFCKRKCGELCDRKPCTEPCYLKLACDHDCVGFCGEPCPPCKTCSPDHFGFILYSDEETADDAKWVLLNDCKHVVETTVMDQWLESNDEDKEIKLKTCPKCRPSEPNRNIMTTQRYMNIAKKTFKDIQAVKEKVYGQVEKIRNERKDLLEELKKISPQEMKGFAGLDQGKDELLLLYDQLQKDLPVVRNQRRKEIDMEELRLLTYMTEYFKTVFNQMMEIWKRINEEAKLRMAKKVNVLTKALRKRKKKISMPEVESFNLELNRIVRYGDLLVLESSAEFTQMKSRQEVLRLSQKANNLINQLSRYTEAQDKQISDLIAELKKTIKCNAQLTAEERKMIHAAMSKSFYGGANAQGHWFKCPNGHIYAIDACGGAMQEARCPIDKCGARIGGTNHRYVEGQRLASEMDNATRPAWSSGYDMANFDLNNLR